MLEIDVNGESVLVDVVFHDSGEEPEAACVNQMVSVKVGTSTFHHPGDDWMVAVQWAVAQMQAALGGVSMTGVPKRKRLITVVMTRYHRSFSIDWTAHESLLSRMTALGIYDLHRRQGMEGGPATNEPEVAAVPTVDEIKPLVQKWFSHGHPRLAGLFDVMLKDGNCEQHFAQRALEQARVAGDAEAIQLAQMLVSVGQPEREQLSKTWHIAN